MDLDSVKPLSADSRIEPVVSRRPNGTILPGHPTIGGRTKGSLNKVTSIMKEELARHIEEKGQRANPLLVLATIYENEEYPPLVRARAAEMLLRYLAPRLMQVEIDQPDQAIETHISSLRTTLRGLLKKE